MQSNRQNQKIKLNINAEEDNTFREEYKSRHYGTKRNNVIVILGIVTMLTYIFVLILPNGMDSNNVHLSFSWWINTLKNNVAALTGMFTESEDIYMLFVVCRYVIVALVGAGLGICGAVYQGSLGNGLASPSTLGVQTGGVLGGTVYVFCFMETETGYTTYNETHDILSGMNILQKYEESFFILAGCMIVVLFVITLAKIAGRGKLSTFAMILTGMIVGSVIGGIIGLIQYWMLMTHTFDLKTYELRFMMLGSFSRTYTPEHLAIVGIPLALGIIAVLSMRSRLNLLVFGEDEARTMGLNVELTRILLLGVVTVMLSVIISFCGMIGFIGFIIPHITRRVTGSDFRLLLPGSALTGSICMMIIYYLATVINYAENINFLTSLVGGFAFLFMLIKYRRNSNADWA